MGQFYKTARPQFVDDFMYKPPYELFKEVIQNKDKMIDEGLAQTAGLSKYLDFQTLDFDRPEAERQKIEYMSKIEELSHKIKEDPMNYQKFTNDIYNLQKDLVQNYTTGKIGVMKGDYESYLKFAKDHEKYKEKEGARYTAGLNAFYDEARDMRKSQIESGGDYATAWNSEQLQNTIDFRKGFLEAVGKMRPDVTPVASSGVRGGFIFKVKGSNETLSEEQVQKLMQDYILSTPNLDDYLRQSERIKLPEDFDSLLDFSRNFAYSKSTREESISRDPEHMARIRAAAASALEDKRQKNREKNIRLKADLEAKSGGFTGEMVTQRAGDMFGSTGLAQINAVREAQGLDPYSEDDALGYGLVDLVNRGVVSPKQATQVDARIKSYSQTPLSFGKKDIVFRIPHTMIVTDPISKKKITYHKGNSYTMTIDKAMKRGLVTDVVKNSGEPFYFDSAMNGVSYQFKGAGDTVLQGMLMPTGTYPQIKAGVAFFEKE